MQDTEDSEPTPHDVLRALRRTGGKFYLLSWQRSGQGRKECKVHRSLLQSDPSCMRGSTAALAQRAGVGTQSHAT